MMKTEGTTATLDKEQSEAGRVIGEISGDKRTLDDGYIQQFGEGNTAGDCIPQGDVYLTKLDRIPEGAKPIHPRAQVAEGETQGSRHILDSLAGVRMYEMPGKSALDGPYLLLEEPRTLTHPEHKHIALAPGCYGIHYQRDLDAEERERRVAD